MKSYREIENLVHSCGGKISYIGTTFMGYPIPMIEKGKDKNIRILLVGSIHAREYITSYLLLELMKNYHGNCMIDCVPILNIDGVILSRIGKNFVENENAYQKLKTINKNSNDFSLWKANIRGVDLNVNFDADWGKGIQNITYQASENYIGTAPESENETKAIISLLKKNSYCMVISYHSKGEEIYYGYGNNKSNKNEAKRVADFLGYKLKMSKNSCGGLKDYFVKEMNGFGITIEVGKNKFSHPYPMNELENLVKLHNGSLELFCNIGEELWKKNLCMRQSKKL